MRVVITDTDTMMQHLHAKIVDELEYKPSVDDVRALFLLHTCMCLNEQCSAGI